MRPFRHALSYLPVIALAAICTDALSADIVYTMPGGFRIESPNATTAGLKWQTASNATYTYLNLSTTATALQRKTARDAAVTAFKAYEAQAPGAKTDIAAAYTALKRAGLTDEFDRAVYANPAAFLTNPGELAAIRGAGGPSAVMANASRHIDQDLADFRTRLGLSSTAWHFNLSPIPRAEAISRCSVAAWAMKTATCWWNKACNSYWESANYNCNGVQ